MNRYFIISVSLMLALILLIFGGCSGGDSSNRFSELLKLIPSEEPYNKAPMMLFDYASYREDKNISFSTSSNNTEVFIDFLEESLQYDLGYLLSGGSFITGYGRYALEGTINDKYVGYDFTCVDAEIQAGFPPGNVVAAIGRFNPQATRDALEYQDEWPSWVKEAYTTEEYRGVTLHSWGDGYKMNMNTRLVPPHIDQLGRARPLAVTETRLFYAPSLEIMKLMIEASQDKPESLADLPEFASILSEMNAYAAVIGDEECAIGDIMFEGTYSGPKLKRFVTFGSGIGEDERGFYMALVIYHHSRENAEANVSLLEQRIADTDSVYAEKPWREVFYDIDIHVEGNILVAKLYTEVTSIWVGWVYDQDSLLVHE
jgi:hypothetical protein